MKGTPKRKPGRPRLAQTMPQRSIRFPAELHAAIEQHRERLAALAPGLDPSWNHALRDLVLRGLESAKRGRSK